jgi:ATP-binding cassette subfamily C protein LapB
MNIQNLPSLELVSVLLHRLDRPVSADELAKASHAATAELADDASIIDWVRRLTTNAQLSGIAPARVPWRRFNIRKLPALLLLDEQWFFVDRNANGQYELRDETGSTSLVDEDALSEAKVLWLRSNPRRSPLSNTTLANNRAAKWVVEALFSEPNWIAKVVLATIVINFFAVTTSLFAMQVYDRVVPTLAYSTLTTLVAGMALVLSLDWVLKTLRARIIDAAAVAVDKRVTQQVFDHLLHLRLDMQPKSLGTLAAQVSGLDSVRNFFSSSVVFGLVDLPFVLLFIAFIAVIGGQVAWVYTLLLPIAVVLGLVAQQKLRHLLKHQMQRQNERQGVLVDAIRGAESIRAANASWRFADDWQSITNSIDAYNIQQKAISQFSTVTIGSLSSLAYVAAIVVGVWQVEAGLLTAGGMIACSIIGGRVIAPIAQGVQLMTQWQHVQQSLQMVNQVLNIDLERRENQNLLVPDELPTALEVEKLQYAYPESPINQVNINNLTFKSGDRVLLVGPVGCGKSTLLKMLAGLYPPTSGRIRLGDTDLWEIDPQIVAAQVGYLPQQVHLFKGSLRSNLALSGSASDSRVMRITRELGIDQIAATSPLGMDLAISEGGDGLSGGQKQLVSLARVLINQPRVWLLDEPTASLDGESETQVWDALENYVQAEDILIVATHRPMQAKKLANRIIVMARGEVVKDGSPQQLAPHWFANKPARTAADQRQNNAGLAEKLAGNLDVV